MSIFCFDSFEIRLHPLMTLQWRRGDFEEVFEAKTMNFFYVTARVENISIGKIGFQNKCRISTNFFFKNCPTKLKIDFFFLMKRFHTIKICSPDINWKRELRLIKVQETGLFFKKKSPYKQH